MTPRQIDLKRLLETKTISDLFTNYTPAELLEERAALVTALLAATKALEHYENLENYSVENGAVQHQGLEMKLFKCLDFGYVARAALAKLKQMGIEV
jgi:hypothetical protein